MIIAHAALFGKTIWLIVGIVIGGLSVLAARPILNLIYRYFVNRTP